MNICYIYHSFYHENIIMSESQSGSKINTKFQFQLYTGTKDFNSSVATPKIKKIIKNK